MKMECRHGRRRKTIATIDAGEDRDDLRMEKLEMEKMNITRSVVEKLTAGVRDAI